MSGDGSDEEKKKRAAFRKRPGRDGDYEVGYGKPPEQTRFKKGRSGKIEQPVVWKFSAGVITHPGIPI